MPRYKPQVDSSVQAAAPENFRIEIENIFRNFLADVDAQEYSFPPALNNLQRKYIHEKVKKLNLRSKSHGKEPKRILTIYKKNKSTQQEYFYLDPCPATLSALNNLYLQYPDASLNGNCSHTKKTFNTSSNTGHNSFGKLGYHGEPASIKAPTQNPLMQFRKTLPIWTMKDELLSLICKKQVLLVSSETGSGKTTQLPQYILESACEANKRCKIICTQPRRISAVSVAERVAAERGEIVGRTVGYQIRLESRIGPTTTLIYCTNGVLLRTLMTDDKCLDHITHIIVDEVHERDKLSDFLLMCIRDSLIRHPNLKLILMSATIDMKLFEAYFTGSHTIKIPGRLYSVKEYFLDEILHITNYVSPAMKQILWQNRSNSAGRFSEMSPSKNTSIPEIDGALALDMNDAIMACVEDGSENSFAQLMQLILSESVCVNYQHPANGYTALMAAAMHENLFVVEQLVFIGANLSLVSSEGNTAIDWAVNCNKTKAVEILSSVNRNFFNGKAPIDKLNMLSVYDLTVTDEVIDVELIESVVTYIHSYDRIGSILIFLPGYDDIINCQDRIFSSENLNMQEFEIFILHGSMQIGSQYRVFERIPNKQKVILSTNISETSITIDDVVYVIDTGRAKEKTYDAISGISSLQSSWISKASVRQRAGRAGRTRPGYCFHIFSKERYYSLLENCVPEMLRVPLHELCLQTKLLAPANISISDFLSSALDPPSSIAVTNSVQSLISLGALDEQENLTDLGGHLLELSVEPHLGKMLIYSVIFKCVDPVLTIVACLAHKDPFMLPTQANLKSLATAKRKELSEDSLSDHMSLLRAFQLWQDAKQANYERQVCKEFFISAASMEMILASRTHLVGQLRASGFIQVRPPDSIQELTSNSENWALVKAVLAVGLYPNLAYLQNSNIFTRTEKKVALHISSCLRSVCDKNKSNHTFMWMIYEEMSKSGSYCNIRCATTITPVTVVLICGQEGVLSSDGTSINIDDWLDFELTTENIYKFRVCLQQVISIKIKNPNQCFNAFEKCVISTLASVLAAEDYHSDLVQPSGIGHVPAPVCQRPLNNHAVQRYSPRTNTTCNYRVGHKLSSSRFNGRQENEKGRTFKNSQASKVPKDCRGADVLLGALRIGDGVSNGTPYFKNHSQNSGMSLGQRGATPAKKASNSGNVCNGGSSDFGKFDLNDVYTPPYPAYDQEFNFPSTSKGTGAVPKASNALLSNYGFNRGNKYFLIKPSTIKNVQIGIFQNSWIFSPQAERKIFRTFHEGYSVILIFTAFGSGQYQGVAKLMGTNNGYPNQPCLIEWLSTTIVSHQRVLELPQHEVHFLHMHEDGSLIDAYVAESLCVLFFKPFVPDDPRARPILGNFSKR